ncbi:conjugal transfer protein TraA [Sphingobium sp. 22B]|uniref:Conjugal transfer protein TraA n=1 Tax=Sphingobium cloacae TaxID=120107 RepID=A0A1E1F8L2_9SPHN|nr:MULTISPECIES: Ti-type conjugative transfer relaxase TraA [Sphingobium]KXU29868.1 conjugal transfer protein TraA [Sphingobium sp. AM]KYC29991.1 conjugal transfer protein TraA [Sphingobium sp. 22B]OAP29598.1 Ti-type conjugative transfer relaxase TraA [Sphingobium sp. 20006FA]BAV66853.1 conjugal transfer protein TraA [Sphingobium cloacae]
MAIYHFSAKVISRANGSSAVASAAYRSASELHDERLGRKHDFSNKAGVIHSEVLLPQGAPERLNDRTALWNEVEAGEKRKDAQLAREVEFSIPREMSEKQGVSLARDFAEKEFVRRGMVADLNVHWDHAKDGSPKPHAHVMLSMREVGPEGFGKKNRDWNSAEHLKGWREAWAAHVNERMAELGLEGRIDHRSYADQGIELEPQHKIGPAGMRRLDRGEDAERAEDHRRIARENGTRIIGDPRIALDGITRQQSTFTTRDLAMFVHRHSDGKEQFDQVMAAVRASPELVALGKDGRDQERFTSREMIATEAQLERAGDELGSRQGHGLPAASFNGGRDAAGSERLVLGGEQQAALEHVASGRDLSIVVGYAGTGKSAMLGIARDQWERQGYQVRGAALSGIAAENLEGGSGIQSRTIASLEHAWAQGRDQLSRNDVLVVDEAGMIGTRQMERVLSHARDAGAKVVLVGDPEQLQAIEAGAAFRSLAERHGAAEITEVRRQREDWQKDATRALATGRTADAIHAYESRGMVQAADTRETARAELVEGWDRQRQAEPDKTRIILTHTNAEVRALNEDARERVRASGELGEDVGVTVERGRRDFASGDRIMFLRNERSLGVKNGTLGTLERIEGGRMAVRLDGGGHAAFDLKDYAHVDHGYAATIHKSQGVTVDRAHVLATPGMDRHGAYVALSRHREGVQLHYGRDDFTDQRQLARVLSRDRAKDMAGDYAAPSDQDRARTFAERREIRFPELAREIAAKVRDKARGMFDGFRPRPAPEKASAPEREPAIGGKPDQAKAIERYARATADIGRMQAKGLPVLPHQESALRKAGEALDANRPHAARDLASALRRDPKLIEQAAGGNTGGAARAMAEERRVRLDPEARAGRFVEAWKAMQRDRAALERAGDRAGAERMRGNMAKVAGAIGRDPQLESALRRRAPELALKLEKDRAIGDALAKSLGPDRERDRGLSR